MSLRILFLGEGTSDSGITTHVRRIAIENGLDVVITDPMMERLPPSRRRTTKSKLEMIKEIGGAYELVIVHRDADRDGRECRLREIETAVAEVMPGIPFAGVIPIRMTEAWLMLDERNLRQVAGNPNGRMSLGLPKPRSVESIPDPKAVLAEKLALASGLSGRKLEKFKKRFPEHRRQLLDRIDPSGVICEVPSWADFNADLLSGLRQASD
ncbi:DUF4276 family protein [Nonomuraea cavernae]|uniref:DUF4276 family protein n=1 Tax=Nonomuraea cavernae TaxID=2045107 RepID=A0A917YTW7_9ACTN|nr:DUF4276 family protein [Nonomuraea cavernae]MCA2185467.1 DUF4276 family protein [Nonomuraea cavernae]GGO66560.1 hypothetical protein GCM10012289_20870 [Nonomuraea cavernae]